jgi:hypothetical protein
MNVVSDDSDADYSLTAGTTVYMDSPYYDFEGTDVQFEESFKYGTVFGIERSSEPLDHPDPPVTEYFLPQWASGTGSYYYLAMDGGGVDILEEDTTTFNITGTYGLSSSKPITQALDLSLWISSAIGTKTIYVAYGTQFNLNISCGYYQNQHDVTLSNTTSGLTVTSASWGGDVTGTLTGNVTISCYGLWANNSVGSATYNIVCVQTNFSHTVVYDGNGGTGSVANTVVSDQNSGNSNVTLAANGFSKSGYSFAGWKIGNVTYTPGQTVAVAGNASVTAVAQWSQNTLSATANNLSAVSGMTYGNQVGASANNGATISFAVKSCTGGTASVNSSGLVTYKAPTVSSTTSYTVTVTATATYGDGQTMSRDVSFTVSVDPVLSFTNAATNGTLSVKGV